MKRFTIDEFKALYPNDDACLDKIFKLRFEGLICPKCESDKPYTRVKDRRAYQCPCCSYQLYPTKDTIFEKSTTPLTYWFSAIYMQTTTRNGVAAKELERTLKICYKTALRMAHQIKILMADKPGKENSKLKGIVQIDETYIGGKLANKHKHIRAEEAKKDFTERIDKKIAVMGFVSDNNELKMEVMTDMQTFKQRVKNNVDTSAILVTDGHAGYKGLDIEFFKHEIINHIQNEYKREQYHTNSIEGVWSLLKRTISGTHINVSVKHLQKYVDEVAFRYMHRDRQDTMFEDVLRRVV